MQKKKFTILPRSWEQLIEKYYPDKKMQRTITWMLFAAFVGLLFVCRPAFASVIGEFLGYSGSTEETYTTVLSGLNARRTIDSCLNKDNIGNITGWKGIHYIIAIAIVLGFFMLVINIIGKVIEHSTRGTLTYDRVFSMAIVFAITILLMINVNFIDDKLRTIGFFTKDELRKASMITDIENQFDAGGAREQFVSIDMNEQLLSYCGDNQELINEIGTLESFDAFNQYLYDIGSEDIISKYEKLLENTTGTVNTVLRSMIRNNNTAIREEIMQHGLDLLKERGFDTASFIHDLTSGLGSSLSDIMTNQKESKSFLVNAIRDTLRNMTDEEYTELVGTDGGVYRHVLDIVVGNNAPSDSWGDAYVRNIKDTWNYGLNNTEDFGDAALNALKVVTSPLTSLFTASASKIEGIILELIIIFTDIGIRIAIMVACFGILGRLVLYKAFLPLGIADIATEGARSNGMRIIKLYFAVYLEIGLFFVINTIGWKIFGFLVMTTDSVSSLIICFIAAGAGIRGMLKSCKGFSERILGV